MSDIPMMTNLLEQVTHVFRIHLVQQVVENYETWFTVVFAKILGYTLVKLTSLCREANSRRETADFSL